MAGEKVVIQLMCKDLELEPGAKLRQVVILVQDLMKDEPMIKTIKQKTGKDHIVFIVNGRIVREPEYDTLEMNQGDDVRWVHPYFGG